MLRECGPVWGAVLPYHHQQNRIAFIVHVQVTAGFTIMLIHQNEHSLKAIVQPIRGVDDSAEADVRWWSPFVVTKTHHVLKGSLASASISLTSRKIPSDVFSAWVFFFVLFSFFFLFLSLVLNSSHLSSSQLLHPRCFVFAAGASCWGWCQSLPVSTLLGALWVSGGRFNPSTWTFGTPLKREGGLLSTFCFFFFVSTKTPK